VKKLLRHCKKAVYCCTPLLFFYAGTAAAADYSNIGTIASGITGSFKGISQLIIAAAFLAGLGFAMAAILKFKAHRDNAQQVPIGAPIALLFVAAALMFLSTVYGSMGATVFSGAAPGSLSGGT
jgi:intracellular multiplication protein IcmD